MRFSTILAGAIGCLATNVSATALSYLLAGSEKMCFYAEAPEDNMKIAFYFAVQSGGSFEIDYQVNGPNHRVILDGQQERQGDFVFTARSKGEYEFCFDNEASEHVEKMIDLEIAVENEVKSTLPSKQGSSTDQTNLIEESVFRIGSQLSSISRNQKYFRTRENRNFSTVQSTERRIVNFSMIQIALIISMGGLQVFIVRFFFQGARKGYV